MWDAKYFVHNLQQNKLITKEINCLWGFHDNWMQSTSREIMKELDGHWMRMKCVNHCIMNLLRAKRGQECSYSMFWTNNWKMCHFFLTAHLIYSKILKIFLSITNHLTALIHYAMKAWLMHWLNNIKRFLRLWALIYFFILIPLFFSNCSRIHSMQASLTDIYLFILNFTIESKSTSMQN